MVITIIFTALGAIAWYLYDLKRAVKTLENDVKEIKDKILGIKS
ncbi:hypothetical protein [Klebsiella oxytoca]|nr:hypothetical protein [Klebsiella oxytoca]